MKKKLLYWKYLLLTKQNRKERKGLYIYMLGVLLDNAKDDEKVDIQRTLAPNMGMCNIAPKIGHNLSDLTQYPELWIQKPSIRYTVAGFPTTDDAFWFPLNREGRKSRIKVVTNALELIEKTI